MPSSVFHARDLTTGQENRHIPHSFHRARNLNIGEIYGLRKVHIDKLALRNKHQLYKEKEKSVASHKEFPIKTQTTLDFYRPEERLSCLVAPVFPSQLWDDFALVFRASFVSYSFCYSSLIEFLFSHKGRKLTNL